MNALGWITPLDTVEAVAAIVETGFLKTVAALSDLPADVWRCLPDEGGALLTVAGPAVAIAAAMVLTFVSVRRLLRRQRQKVDREHCTLAALLKLWGLELVALAAAAIVGRVLLVRGSGIPPGTPGLPHDLTIAVVRWLFGITLAIIVFQPAARRFRLALVDDAGARRATWSIAAMLALGHLHIALLDAAQRGGLSTISAKLISCIVGLCMAAGAVRLFAAPRHRGMMPALRPTAIPLTLVTCLLWLWGWTAGDFELYRATVGTIAGFMVALALDRAVALGIRDSDRPDVTRMLLVVRVVVAALAAALMLRIVVDVWVMGAFGWLSPEQWHGFSRRLTVASAMLVVAAALAAIAGAAMEAWLTPAPGAPTPDIEALLARRSTVLPILRFAATALIGVVFSLLALSALGVDDTALLAGAAMVGLAIGFGSQSLVRDIVAGLFYMIDDVFRLGEIIEAGGRRCRLERIDLRSVRLRDEDGILHTVRFGELGTVNNHSRRLVRMTALVTMATIPAKSELARFCEDAAAVLRREPMVNPAIVGFIEVRLDEAPGANPSTLAFSFSIAATAADRTRSLVQRLFEETVNVAGIEALSPSVSVTVADLSDRHDPSQPSDSASDAYLPHPDDTLNMA
jgi:small-conductance mechanosensitive channel